jgi:hypothetical protein
MKRDKKNHYLRPYPEPNLSSELRSTSGLAFPSIGRKEKARHGWDRRETSVP